MFDSTTPHEPEGFVSTASAVGSAFAGLFYGLVVRHEGAWRARVTQWTFATTILTGAGVAIAMLSDVGINKKIYTVSYMLLTSGMAGAVLMVVYLTADVLGGRVLHAFYFPLMCVGMNAIMIYVGDSVGWRLLTFIYYEVPEQTLTYELIQWVVGWCANPSDGRMVWACLDAAIWTAVAMLLWWRKIFFKV